MLSVEQFVDLGLFVKEDFLERELLNLITSEISYGESKPTFVITSDSDSKTKAQLRTTMRQTEEIKLSSKTKSLVEKRLTVLKPQLENYFELDLNKDQGLLFYRYKQGNFFTYHRDNSDNPDAPDILKQRRVSVIIFLNEMNDEPSLKGYSGGDLVFYGLFEDPIWQSYGFHFPSKPGMLVAFRSDVYHEVKPVISGERYTAVDWFL